MKEDYLHYLWKFGRFDQKELTTFRGEPVEILRRGIHNSDSGPDFSEALIRIGQTLWAGAVEIHVRASEWHLHSHDTDPAYDLVILHVVWENDQEIRDRCGNLLPTVTLKERSDPSVFRQLEQWQKNSRSIPCCALLSQVPDIVKTSLFQSMAVQRLERKAKKLSVWLDEEKGNWENVAYRSLMASFGSGLNTDLYSELAGIVSLSVLKKHRHDPLAVEALLSGMAGLLPEQSEYDYVKRLRSEFNHFMKLYSLAPMEGHRWKFMRTRPVNFPTVRLAQLAAFICSTPSIFDLLITLREPDQLIRLLPLPRDEFWNEHYRFADYGPSRTKKPGKALADTITINTAAPLLFLYGERSGNEELFESALRLLEKLSPERNRFTRLWDACGETAANALESQGQHELYHALCLHKKCLTCSIGITLLKR